MRRVHDGVPAALADEPDAVHRLRTSVRRLRNVLAAFKRYLDRDAAAELRSRLKELGDVLGKARDLEVRAQQ
ncbi:CHAD domain-containing protein, partial [Promicromonospora sukumoe]